MDCRDYMLELMAKPVGPKTDKPTSIHIARATMDRVDQFVSRHGLSNSRFFELAALDFLDRMDSLPAFEELLALRRKELDAQTEPRVRRK